MRSAMLLACAAVPLVLAQTSAAGTLYWDPDGNAANNTPPITAQGGAGTWTSADTKWYNGVTDVAAAGTDSNYFGGTAGIVTIDAGGVTSAGVNFLTDGYTLTGGQLTINGNINTYNGSNAIISAPVGATGTQAVGKYGVGVLTMSGNNSGWTSTGVFTLYGGLTLDYSSQNNSKISDSSRLTLRGWGGTVTLSGGSHAEVVNGLTVGTNGNSASAWTITQSGGSSVLNLNNATIIRSGPTHTIYFGSANLVTNTSTANTNGILGGWATVNGTDWATVSSGSVAALGTYDDDTTWTALKNITVTQASLSPTANFTINSLRFNSPVATTLTLSGATGNTITSTGGTGGTGGSGLLVTPNVGANNILITGGIIKSSGNGTDLIVHQYNTAGTLEIDSVIGAGNQYLTKTGPGTLILGGSTAQTYTGGTHVLGGTLILNKDASVGNNALGIAATGGNLYIMGATVQLQGRGEQINNAYVVSMGGRTTPSYLDLGGYTETLGYVAAMFGNSEIKNGSLVWSSTTASVAMAAQGGNNLVSANMDVKTPDVANGQRILSVTDVAHSMELSGVVSDSGTHVTNPLTFDKFGLGTVTFSNTANTFTGGLRLNQGILEVKSLANGGANSSVGASSNGASNLVFNNATLKYTGAGSTSDRLFTINAGGATIDSSGAGALNLNNPSAEVTADVGGSRTGRTTNASTTLDQLSTTSDLTVGMTVSGTNIPAGTVITAISAAGSITMNNAATAGGTGITITFGGAVNRTLTLTGSNTGNNTLAAVLPNSAAATLGLNKTGSGKWFLSGANSYSGGTTVGGGTLVVGHANALGSGGLTVNAGATAALNSGLGNAVVLTSLGVNATGKVDVNDDALIVTSGGSVGRDTLTARIAAARNGGAWDGYGITSSAAQAVFAENGYDYKTLGIVLNSDLPNGPYSIFAGRAVGANDVLVKYTWGGDADLNGIVDGDDYFAIDTGFLTPGASGWINGDFNHDGLIDGDDYFVIDSMYINSGGQLSSAQRQMRIQNFGANYLNTVPEPAGLGILAVLGAGLLRRNRRR